VEVTVVVAATIVLMCLFLLLQTTDSEIFSTIPIEIGVLHEGGAIGLHDAGNVRRHQQRPPPGIHILVPKRMDRQEEEKMEGRSS